MQADGGKRFWGWVGALWGIVGITLLLGFAVVRLTPIALEALGMDLEWWHYVVLVVWVAFMMYSEAWRGFQKGFSPRVAGRCRELRDAPTALHVALAPLFAMSFFAATRKRKNVAYALTSGIIVLVVVVQQLAQPWRGIIDVGVVLGLTYGWAATVVFWARAMRASAPEAGAAQSDGDTQPASLPNVSESTGAS